MVQGRVHPDCRNADNPYDECTQYCFTIIAEAKKRTSKDEPVREKKIVRALLFGQWIRSRQVLSLLGNEYQIEAYPKTIVVLVRNHGVYIWGETGISAKTQKLKTRVVKNNLHPEWNEDLTPSITDTNLPVKLGRVRDYSPSGYSMPPRNQNSGNASEYGSAKYANQDHRTPKSYGNSGSMHSKDRSTSYQNETVEPCNFSSSIHYGGQEVYSTDIQPKKTHSAFKKDGRDDDSNGSNSNASRGNWWQGSLYY